MNWKTLEHGTHVFTIDRVGGPWEVIEAWVDREDMVLRPLTERLAGTVFRGPADDVFATHSEAADEAGRRQAAWLTQSRDRFIRRKLPDLLVADVIAGRDYSRRLRQEQVTPDELQRCVEVLQARGADRLARAAQMGQNRDPAWNDDCGWDCIIDLEDAGHRDLKTAELLAAAAKP